MFLTDVVIPRLAKRAEGSHPWAVDHTPVSKRDRSPCGRSLAVFAARDDTAVGLDSELPTG